MEIIPNDNNIEDVHLHIEKGYKIINDFLPSNYVEKVFAKLKSENYLTVDIIRNIRRKKQTPKRHLKVFNALIEVALENKSQTENLQKLINKP